jgi:hypothetical protein
MTARENSEQDQGNRTEGPSSAKLCDTEFLTENHP